MLRAAERLSAVPSGDFAATARECLQQIIGSEFRVAPGSIVDATGSKSGDFPIVIYRQHAEETVSYPQTIPADRVAVVVDICGDLSSARLDEAYSRIAEAKQLVKSAVPKGEVRSNRTLGIILAQKSVVSLDLLAEQLYQLACRTTHAQWLDMLVVDSVGTINQAFQFPGENVSGNFLPPAEGALAPPAPPAFYVTIVMRPTGAHSFNALVAFIVGHLVFFAPQVAESLPNSNLIVDGQATTAITTLGFQTNLSGELVPVPAEGYNGAFIPNKPIQLEDPQGQVLGALQFIKWQTGGVILMAGKLPLEGMLMFLPNLRPEYTRVLKRPTHQISPVLPISEYEFNQFLLNIQARSNIRVRKDVGGIVKQRFLEEGASSPFIARCTLGLLRIRENVLTEQGRRNDFDKRFESAFSALLNAREAGKKLCETWKFHADRVASGVAAQIEGRDIRIQESINKQLSGDFESFLNASTRAIKTGVQGICSFLGLDIGYLFKKQSAFDANIQRLRHTDSALADYLVEVRKWSERLLLLRNNLEHDIWEFPKVRYEIVGDAVRATEPQLSGEEVTALVNFLLDRTLCFFEDMIAHVLQRHLPPGVSVAEIPRDKRSVEAPERFQITPYPGGKPRWRIVYHAARFEEI